MPKLTQDQIRAKMQRLDNVFHRMVVALERLEIFTEAVRLGGNANTELSTTAIRTDRDMHDDASNPPTRDSFYGEVQLQLSALYFQTQIDDKEIFNPAVKYFLGDLLEWYGGRSESIPYNGIDAFVLPIIVALSQQVKDVAEIMEVVEKYVAVIPGISSYSDEEKAEAIANGMEKLILVTEHNHEQSHQSDLQEDVIFTVHKRGEQLEGYKRLINAMLHMYNEAMPAIVVFRTIDNFLPEITAALPTITEENIVEFITSKNSQDSVSTEESESNSNTSNTNDESGTESDVEPIFEPYDSSEKFSDKEENVESEVPANDNSDEEKAAKEPGFIEKVVNLFK